MRLTLIALCLMTAIAAEAKSGNNGTELPSWILEPEEGLFIGISFPGEGREQALAFAEFSMYLGEKNAISAKEEIVMKEESYNIVFFSTTRNIRIDPTKLSYDIVKETQLPSGEYAVAIKKGNSITTRISADITYYSGQNQKQNTVFHNISFAFYSNGGSQANMWVKKMSMNDFQMIQSSDGYMYSSSSKADSYRLPGIDTEVMLYDYGRHSFSIQEPYTVYFCDNSEPLSISMLYGTVEKLASYCSLYATSSGSTYSSTYDIESQTSTTNTSTKECTFTKQPVLYHGIFLDDSNKEHIERTVSYTIPRQYNEYDAADVISLTD